MQTNLNKASPLCASGIVQHPVKAFYCQCMEELRAFEFFLAGEEKCLDDLDVHWHLSLMATTVTVSLQLSVILLCASVHQIQQGDRQTNRQTGNLTSPHKSWNVQRPTDF